MGVPIGLLVIGAIVWFGALAVKLGGDPDAMF